MVTGKSGWLNVLRRYLVAMALGNLVWEFAHMPLYTLWETGSPSAIAFAAIHCTGGDILIATSALLAALLLFGNSQWPEAGYRRVGLAAIAIGLGYTVFSEWLNIEVRQAWAYRDLMPVIPVIDAGLSPVAQWIVLPIITLWWAAPRHDAPWQNLRENGRCRKKPVMLTTPAADRGKPARTCGQGAHGSSSSSRA